MPRIDPDEWAQVSGPFREAVESYFTARGADLAAANVQSTVRTNTELVPRRAENLLELLESLAGIRDLEGLRIVEAGCGFGALATCLASACRPRRLVAFDVRADYVESARRSVEPLGLAGRLEFRQADMRDFAGLEDASADLLLANNALIYLATRAELCRALDAIARVTAPGGHVLLYHANRWRPREPFTGAPVVHTLPAPLGRRVGDRLGWKHNHGRVRLISAPELGFRLAARGFRQVRVGAPHRGTVVGAPKALFGSFYGLTAQRR